MNEYLFYSVEGETLAPEHECDVNNCQLLGISKGINKNDALQRLLNENSWIGQAGYDAAKITGIQVLSNSIKKDIEELIEYLWSDELRHYEENDYPKNHIFRVLMQLKRVLNS